MSSIFPFWRIQNLCAEAFQRSKRGNGTAEAEDCGAGQWRKIRQVNKGLLLSVAVFAGLSGRLDLLGPVLVYMLASLPKSLSGCSNGFALGKTSWKEKLY